MTKKAEVTLQKLDKLKTLLAGRGSMLIVMQDNPDPDSIASAVALRRLVNTIAQVPCSIGHGGTIGRGENRALVRYLGLNLHRCSDINYSKFDLTAIVDTQPMTGNNSLPEEVTPDIVIDHHPARRTQGTIPFTDIRSRYGATATILLEYLQQAQIKPDMPLATALLYAIRSDTQDLGREASKADVDAIHTLFPLANHRMLSVIQRGAVPKSYFSMLSIALNNARIYGRAIVTSLGPVTNPDMIAEVADLLLREDDTTWTYCTGVYRDKLLLSVRTSQDELAARDVIHHVVARRGTGGGHRTYAGGQVPLPEKGKARGRRLEEVLRDKFLEQIGMADQMPERLVLPQAALAAECP